MTYPNHERSKLAGSLAGRKKQEGRHRTDRRLQIKSVKGFTSEPEALIVYFSWTPMRENCGIISKQASTDGGVLWKIVRVNVVQVRRKDRSLRGKIPCQRCFLSSKLGKTELNALSPVMVLKATAGVS
ncbi:hypothetical protein TNCV_626981 [Trichonephila clavipes]|nr:hypothetical protein TNCV_626981 [Trichonephila clavipes]